jgi:putative peptidoglycan lipid II flippase
VAAEEGDAPTRSDSGIRRRRRLARNTAFFSVATGFSRVAGLVREIVAASYFGVKGPMSAFTIAYQVPNLMRALFADFALQGAFVPVFTELLEKDKRREAFRVASSLFLLICLVLGGMTLLFLLVAPWVIELFTPGFDDDPFLRDLTVDLSRIMFPILILLALSGLIVGMLNSFEHFSVPALAPIAWNLVIIAALVGFTPLYPEGKEIYAYAWGVLAGTIVQLLMPLPWLRGRGGRFNFEFDWRNRHVRQVLKLMLPVTITLGLINFSLLINSFFGTLVSDEAPAAIDKAFRVYMLPQGLFSVAIATILFPVLSRYAAREAWGDLRHTMANGVRQVCLLLIPCAVIMAVLAEPITRLLYQRGEFDAEATDLVAVAMFWWAFSLPASGVSLMFSRTFFSMQKVWPTTTFSGLNLALNALISFVLYKPFGVGGVVVGTVVGTIGMMAAQAYLLRRDLEGIEGARTLAAALRMIAAALLLGAVSYGIWYGLDTALGRALWAQAVSLGVAVLAGAAAYAAAVWALRIPEVDQIRRLLLSRLGRGDSTA